MIGQVPDKKQLKRKFLKPKVLLRKTRLSKEISQKKMGELIGISREQYAKKERGEYAFQDYEMKLIANYLKDSESKLFF